MTKTNVFVVAAAASLVAGAAAAQQTAFDNADRTTDAVAAVEEQVEDSYDRGMSAFGNSGRTLGWTGSVSASMTASKGSVDALNLGMGARLGYYDGTNGHRLSIARNYKQADGATTQDEALFGYDYTRDFGDRLFGFGKASVAYDAFSDTKADVFLGAGVGYRVIDSAKVQWSVQGGPGYRYAIAGDDSVVAKEVAVAVSSYYSNQLADSLFLTNDTDILWSENMTTATNELGLSVAMTDALALRTSLTTKFAGDKIGSLASTNNTLGMSVVYSFN